MNFLAHLLSGDSGDEMLVGSFAGDFCRGSIEKHRKELRAGIRLHRLVDAYADDHPAFSTIRAMLRPVLGLYAPVGADMLIDHLLARDWNRWIGDESLTQFADRVGMVLLDRADWLPPQASVVARMMVAGQWLESYAKKGGIRTALVRMTRRTRGDVDLSDSLLVLANGEKELLESIDWFLTDLFSSQRLIEARMRDVLRTRGR